MTNKFNEDYINLKNILINHVGVKVRYLEKTGTKNASQRFLKEQDEKILTYKKAIEELLNDSLDFLRLDIKKRKNREQLDAIEDYLVEVRDDTLTYLNSCKMRYNTNVIDLKKQDVMAKLFRENVDCGQFYDSALTQMNENSREVVESISYLDYLNCFPFLNANSAIEILKKTALVEAEFARKTRRQLPTKLKIKETEKYLETDSELGGYYGQ